MKINSSKIITKRRKRLIFILQFFLFFSILLLIYNTIPFQNSFNFLKDSLSLSILWVPKEFQHAHKLWRPEQVYSEKEKGEIDFGGNYDERIFEQRRWIKNMTKSKIFTYLKPKRILVEDSDFYSIFPKDGKLNCSYEAMEWETKCKLELENNSFNANTNTYPENINEFDAVVEFLVLVGHPNPKHERKLPKESSVQKIIFTLESPGSAEKINLSLSNALLASYWHGSDIPVPYGKWVPYTNLSTREYVKRLRDARKVNHAEGKSKSKLAAIIVSDSDCKANNSRLEYVKELQRHMGVDVYGKCGNFNCTEEDDEETCFENLGKDYKFYLAFENANCRDYITENFFRHALLNDMVPVVLGAHKKDYLAAAPPNSFIHVEDFESPKQLADYLLKLNKNKDLYNTFFEWKYIGEIQTREDFTADFFCRACALLFVTDFIKAPVWPRGATWETTNVCLPEGKLYWGRPK